MWPPWVGGRHGQGLFVVERVAADGGGGAIQAGLLPRTLPYALRST